jgi:hypothetical protein
MKPRFAAPARLPAGSHGVSGGVQVRRRRVREETCRFGRLRRSKADRFWLNRDGSFYTLNGLARDTLDRNAATLKLNARYTQGIATFNLRASAEMRRDNLVCEGSARFVQSRSRLHARCRQDGGEMGPGLRLESGRHANQP